MSTATPTEKSGDVVATITTSATPTTGTYTLTVTMVAAGVTTTKSTTFGVTGGSSGTALTEATLTVGANGNSTLGSSIDFDADTVYKMAAAASHVADLDLCYSYSGTANVEKLFSPEAAKASGFTYATGWASPNTIVYGKVASSTTFESITTAEELTALWHATSTQAGGSMVCAQGDVFVVQTNLGVLVLVKIQTLAAGETGSIVIKAAK